MSLVSISIYQADVREGMKTRHLHTYNHMDVPHIDVWYNYDSFLLHVMQEYIIDEVKNQ